MPHIVDDDVSSKNGLSACSNRLTIRAKIADAALLEGMKAELLAPATVRYITEALAAALNRRIDAPAAAR